MTGPAKIVVGVDGSECSKAALRWAADEARRRDAELFPVIVFQAPVTSYAYGGYPNYPYGTPTVALPEHIGILKTMLEDTVAEVLGDDPPVTVVPAALHGNPAKVLIDLSEDADLVVVGTRGHGGFVGKLLGSVSHDVAAHAACTTVIVRDHH